MLTLLAGHATAANRWSDVGVHDEGTAAWSTVIGNDQDSVLMYYCDSGTEGLCGFLIQLDTACDEGMSVPALVSLENGAGHVSLVCGGRNDDGYNYRLVSDNMVQLRDEMRSSRSMSIAFPMDEGGFVAVKFSLLGSAKAFNEVERVSNNLPEPESKSTYKQPVESGRF